MKKFNSYIIGFLGLLALSGCDLPTAVWSKQGVTHDEYAADDDDCRQQVEDNKFNFGVGPATGANRKEFYERCMKDLGYHREGEKQEDHLHNPSGVLAPAF